MGFLTPTSTNCATGYLNDRILPSTNLIPKDSGQFVKVNWNPSKNEKKLRLLNEFLSHRASDLNLILTQKAFYLDNFLRQSYACKQLVLSSLSLDQSTIVL